MAISGVVYRIVCVKGDAGLHPSKARVLCKLPVEEGRLSLVGDPYRVATVVLREEPPSGP